MSQFRKELSNPSNEYRSAPFWAWNGKMKAERTKEQIDGMKEQRMGGCFLHSREGLETEYLSKEWMDCIKDTVDYADEQKLDAWIYDEDKWPSGMAGGMVVKADDKYRAKALTLGHGRDGSIKFFVESSGDSEWYNGYGPANNLDPESVKKFIELTHEEYKVKLGAETNAKVKGYFTDEPNICDFFSTFIEGRPWLPWSDNFPEYFKERRGYDIMEQVEGLFFEKDYSKKIRHDYCKTISELFSTSYFQQISEWLHENDMQFTGHLIFENDLGYNARTSGSVMPHYRFFDIPGIDILGEQDKELLTVKQCTSVANQFGKKYVMSETYGCTKWDFGLEGQKWLGDWQFIQGVTMRCQHLFMYSIKGLRKRDYPPIFSEQTTWWEHSNLLEDYFGRFAVCNTYGKVKRDILVVHPQSSVWLHAGSRAHEDLKKWDDNMGWLDEHFLVGNEIGGRFQRILKNLQSNHQDFDLGDEMLMEEFGSVKEKEFCINEGAYKIVVIPPIENIFRSTIDLIEEFLNQGGVVVAMGDAPKYVDGEMADTAERLYKHPKMKTFHGVREALNYVNTLAKDIEVVTELEIEDASIMTMYREIPEGTMLICSNQDREKNHQVCVRMVGKGAIEKISLVDGSSEYVDVIYDENTGKMSLIDTIGAVETVVYILHNGVEFENKKHEFTYEHPHMEQPIFAALDFRAKVKRDSDNILPLDVCRFKLGDTWSEKMPVWEAQKAVREQLKMKQVWQNGIAQRYTWIYNKHEMDGTALEFEFEFEVDSLEIDNLKIALEEKDGCSVSCNGVICEESDGYFLDPAIKKVLIPKSCIKLGKNYLQLEWDFEEKMELEDCYLLGDFAVSQSRQLTKENRELVLGDWCFQGYPHYGGGLSYFFNLDKNWDDDRKVFLSIPEWKAAVLEVYINDKKVKVVGWKGQDGFEISEYLEATNKVEVKLVASLRNVFGPFHQKYDSCVRSSFKDFRTQEACYTEEYSLEPQGLMKPVVLKRR